MVYAADLLRTRMLEINSPERLLPAGRIAVLVPAMVRHDQRAFDLAGEIRSLREACAAGARRSSRCSR